MMARSGRFLGCLVALAAAACLWHFLPDILAQVVARRERS